MNHLNGPMPKRFIFDAEILHSVAGGRSAIDIPKLNIHSREEAQSFLHSYGFHLDQGGEEDRLWYFHRRALVLLTERLGFQESEIPEVLRDRKLLGGLHQLLIWASSSKPEEKDLQRWSCAILRCMHVFVHTESDLLSFFAEEIQSQILSGVQDSIYHDGTTHQIFLKSRDLEKDPIPLVGFEVKPFKNSQSTAIKLLAKPDALAMKVFDKLGIRFVTRSLFDSFQVIRFLVEENLISFPHIMPDQSSNNLYPVDLFVQVCRELQAQGKTWTDDQVSELFEARLTEAGDEAKFLRKPNEQSSEDFRFIKFITRKLIRVAPQNGKEAFSFFYPFEVQIMDDRVLQKIKSGPSEHEAYKERQRLAARRRVLPEVKA